MGTAPVAAAVCESQCSNDATCTAYETTTSMQCWIYTQTIDPANYRAAPDNTFFLKQMCVGDSTTAASVSASTTTTTVNPAVTTGKLLPSEDPVKYKAKLQNALLESVILYHFKVGIPPRKHWSIPASLKQECLYFYQRTPEQWRDFPAKHRSPLK